MDIQAEGSPHRRTDRWAVRSLWFVLLALAGFTAWSYAEGGLVPATSFAVGVLVVWIRGFLQNAVVFGILSLALSAWPGGRSFWLGTTVLSVLTAIPVDFYNAATTSFNNIAASPFFSPFTRFLLLHSWLEFAAYVLLLLAVTTWVTLLYFPKLRGWRFAVFWVVTVASGLALPAGSFWHAVRPG
ncbi:MAG: hypothetical protein M0Z66_03975 [Thermaerobacter sp.]|nr:hypothetical protein [Thermaerobacter sp.]